MLREVLHFVRNGADFLQCELVCLAWRTAVGEDALWEPRPIGYGDGVLDEENSFTGRRGCLESAAHLARGMIQRSSDQASESVFGFEKSRQIVECLYRRCRKHSDPDPHFSDGAIVALYDIVEHFLDDFLTTCLRLAIHRSRQPEGHDDALNTVQLYDTGGTVGSVDFFLQRGLLLKTMISKNLIGDSRHTITEIERFLIPVVPPANQFHGFVDDRLTKLSDKAWRKRFHEQGHLDLHYSDAELTRLVRRIARRASVVAVTGAAMDLIGLYYIGALGAILENVYRMHSNDTSDVTYHHGATGAATTHTSGELPPSDDDDYSSQDETSDDEDPTPIVSNGLAQDAVVPPSTLTAARFKVTIATVTFAAQALKITDGYYSARLDDDDSDEDSADCELPPNVREDHLE